MLICRRGVGDTGREIKRKGGEIAYQYPTQSITNNKLGESYEYY